MVEEIISFAALDNIRDLTCVSLFAVCLDTVTVRFHVGKQVSPSGFWISFSCLLQMLNLLHTDHFSLPV